MKRPPAPLYPAHRPVPDTKKPKLLPQVPPAPANNGDDTDSLTEELPSDDEVGIDTKPTTQTTKPTSIPKEKGRKKDKTAAGKTSPKAGKGKTQTKTAKPKDKKGKTESGGLSGCNFVFTGVMEGASREEYVDKVKELGGKVTSAVSSRTTYLVYGEILEDGRPYNLGKKYLKAVELHKTVLSQLAFLDLIQSFQSSPRPPTPQDSPSGPKTDPLITQWRPAPTNPTDQPLLWTEKYAPQALKDLIGNSTVVDKLLNWVKDWESVILKGEKKEIVVRGGHFDPQKNVNARVALVSGPPGIGKTTAGRLVAKALGYRPIELNASDVRNKSALAPIRASCQNTSLSGTDLVKALIIMDEVDGMAGGDRGGVGAIVDIIKNAQIPVICICNDRGCQKLKPLVNVAYDLRFVRPNKTQIVGRLKAIAELEGMNVEVNALERLVESAGNDIRQVLTALELISRTSLSLTYRELRQFEGGSSKDSTVMISAFDAAASLMRRTEVKSRKMRDNLGLFFIDFDLIPLLVQENCLNALGELTKPEDLSRVCDAMAFGDVMNRKIHQDNEWSLLPLYGLFAAVVPGFFCVSGVVYPKFPEWFGRGSTQKRKERLVRELKQAMSQYPSSSDSLDLLSFSIPVLYRSLLDPLQSEGKDAIDDVLDLMYTYNLTPDMLKEHLIDLQMSAADPEQPYKDLPTSVKSALTRVFNQFNPDTKAKKRRSVENNSEKMDRFDPDVEEIEGNKEDTDTEEEEIEEVSISQGKTKGKSRKKQGKKS